MQNTKTGLLVALVPFAMVPLFAFGASLFSVDESGNIGFGNSSPLHRVDISGAIYSRLVTATSTTINWNLGNVQHLSLTSSPTLTFTGAQSGGKYDLVLVQDGTGGRTVTWPSSILWSEASAPIISSAPNATNTISFIYDGGAYLGTVSFRSQATTYAKFDSGKCNGEWTLTSGSLVATKGTSNNWRSCLSDVGKSSGKWYWEVTVTTDAGVGGGDGLMVGVGNSSVTLTSYLGQTGWAYEGNSGGSGSAKWDNNSSIAYGNTYTTGDVIMVAMDMDNGKLWWGKNGIWQGSGNPAAGTNAAYTDLTGTLYAGTAGSDGGTALTANFGGSAFSYAVPSGFNAGLY